MYVCHCRAVTDHTIEDAIRRGATTIEELVDCCDAGADCGGCWPELEKLLERHGHRQLATTHR
jgi:bacterioferritin-associated ferredoxin